MELQETGMTDYGWRQYMPEIGRWNGIDQLAEKYFSTGTYTYVANNPISNADIDGRQFNDDGSIDVSGIANGFVRTRSYTQSYLGQFAGQGGGGMTIGELLDQLAGKSFSTSVDFSQFDFTKYNDDKSEAIELKKQYNNNVNIQMAETILSEALLETTKFGQVLKYSRQALVRVYGDEDIKSINKVYSIIVNKIDFYKKSLSGSDNAAYNTIAAGIITALGANSLRLEVKNQYILYRIKKIDINVYRTIFPEYTTSRFGGGGAKGKW